MAMWKGAVVLGVLLALQTAGLQYYYQQKYEGLDPAACRAALAELAAAGATSAPHIEVAKECTDADERCEQWASSGECEKNEAFMIGTEQAPGQCVKACNKCPGVAAATEAPVEADVAVEAE
ncbi:hypothetical protein CHLNCDRAFT_135133 [Chlorella variabilis]|uniref:ShKT domain-containing protein n=1 Tax=Chlorella variabilis TaxID=554065 RepID=E1ZHJ9_CHLVA|nr:hypothetical protein CHLNCDRAFT_135133 [Chlorella variabilis]EFN54476.1 hypothetical protein CHLNCDRAFT_135133 [Chlorella variabilis]|eukprot:XP_005846578.1 hypothetical protein CHLNCDRAFT_135133 [Chlorella variabilis]